MKKAIHLLFCVFIISCSNPKHDYLRSFVGSYKNYYMVKGKVKNDRYYSPNEIFSVEVINLIGPGIIINDSFNKDFGRNEYYQNNVGTVSFMDDFETFYRIDVFQIPKNFDYEKYEIDNVLKATMEYTLIMYRESFSNSKIIYQDFLYLDNKRINYFIANLNNGSTFTINGNKIDSLRASMTFVYGDYVYVVSVQHTKDRPPYSIKLNDKLVEELKNNIIKIINTMKMKQ